MRYVALLPRLVRELYCQTTNVAAVMSIPHRFIRVSGNKLFHNCRTAGRICAGAPSCANTVCWSTIMCEQYVLEHHHVRTICAGAPSCANNMCWSTIMCEHCVLEHHHVRTICVGAPSCANNMCWSTIVYEPPMNPSATSFSISEGTFRRQSW